MPVLLSTPAVLNARQGPGTSFPILARLPRSTRLTLLGEDALGRWARVRTELVDGPLEAWVSRAYVTEDPAGGPPPANGLPWLDVAQREVGTREYPGPVHNPRIIEYHATTTLKATIDEVPWCSSFANFCVQQAGLVGTKSAAARSWLHWGVSLPAPRFGCVAVFRRGSDPSQGHVAFFVRRSGAFLMVLGGNQSNRVGIDPYPAERLVGLRWPA